jgi:hypothetical protein
MVVRRSTPTIRLRGEGRMMESPWHSIKQNYYHVCTNCNSGSKIESENLRQGTGDKPLCQECQYLINKNRCLSS